MKKNLLIAATLLAATLTAPAMAAPVTWTFGALDEGDGQHTYVQGPYTLNVSAYKTGNDNGNGLFSLTPLKGWAGSGLGAGTEGSPNHAVDNDGRDEFILFDFGNANYLATAFQLGWYTDDDDVDVWVGGSSALNFSTLCFAGCGAGNSLTDKGFTKVNFDEAGTSSHSLSTPAGRYLIIAAAAGSGADDKFKILSVSGDLPSIRVPEPGSLALLGLGVAGLVAMRRKSA